MAGNHALKKASGLSVTPHPAEMNLQSRLVGGSRAFLALLVTLCLRVASWTRSTAVPGTRSAVGWVLGVAIPTLRHSHASRYLRRRRLEVSFLVGGVVVAVAVGWLLIGLLRELS